MSDAETTETTEPVVEQPAKKLSAHTIAAHERQERTYMWYTQVRVPGDLELQIRRQSKATGQSLNAVVVERLKEGFGQDDGCASRGEISLEDAAIVFYNHLDPDHKRILTEVADEYHRPFAEFMLSAIKSCHDRGETSRVLPMEPMAETKTHRVGREAVSDQPDPDLLCEFCNKPIERPYTRDGQRFCHPNEETGESCGRMAHEREMAEQGEPASSYMNPAELDLRKILPPRRRR